MSRLNLRPGVQVQIDPPGVLWVELVLWIIQDSFFGGVPPIPEKTLLSILQPQSLVQYVHSTSTWKIVGRG